MTAYGDKALFVPAAGRRRNASVIVCINYRRYSKFISNDDQDFEEGISFKNAAGKVIANYPKQHSANCTRKHKATEQWFKPAVRIVKNMRGRLVDDGVIEDGLAPSYFVEGLFYNVPDEQFGISYQDTIYNCLSWLHQADRTNFVCANEQCYLLREDSPVTWRADKCEAFLSALNTMWNEW